MNKYESSDLWLSLHMFTKHRLDAYKRLKSSLWLSSPFPSDTMLSSLSISSASTYTHIHPKDVGMLFDENPSQLYPSEYLQILIMLSKWPVWSCHFSSAPNPSCRGKLGSWYFEPQSEAPGWRQGRDPSFLGWSGACCHLWHRFKQC